MSIILYDVLDHLVT